MTDAAGDVIEPCVMCDGTGRVTITWDFGATAEKVCTYCSGSGFIRKEMLYRFDELVNKAMQDMKAQIEREIFAPSPIIKHMTGLRAIIEDAADKEGL